ncbi:kinase-like domain-containing protein [Desarmillaria ectypa]|nr:kinase-like domain-containing protein [Desarmillaria ectypa]
MTGMSGGIDLVMELVRGGDLCTHIQAGLTDDEGAAKFIIWQICDALANVLLSDNLPPIVKLTDFGLAKIVDEHTMLRTGCGTPEYMPPEQFQSDGYDHLVDSWGAGIILFTMFTKFMPIERPKSGEQRPKDDWDPLIPWHLLDEAEVTEEGKEFAWAFLRSKPKERMTMRNAVKYEWISPWVDEMRKARDKLVDVNANRPCRYSEQMTNEAFGGFSWYIGVNAARKNNMSTALSRCVALCPSSRDIVWSDLLHLKKGPEIAIESVGRGL